MRLLKNLLLIIGLVNIGMACAPPYHGLQFWLPLVVNGGMGILNIGLWWQIRREEL